MANRKTRRAQKALARDSKAAPARRLTLRPKPQRHWLLAGTALVTGVVAGGVLLATSDEAHAQPPAEACGPLSGSAYPHVVDCTGTFNNGVFYDGGGAQSWSGSLVLNLEDALINDSVATPPPDASLQIFNFEDVTVNGEGDFNKIDSSGRNGIEIVTRKAFPGAGDANITVNGINGEVDASGSGSHGIVLNTEDGDISLTLFEQDLVQAYGHGVYLRTGSTFSFDGGDITATNYGTIVTRDSGNGGHGILAVVEDQGSITIANNGLGSIHAERDGIHARGTGNDINIINGEGNPPQPDGLIDALEDGIWAVNDGAGNIFVYNGKTSNSQSQIYAAGHFGIYASSIDDNRDPLNPGHVEAYNFGLVEVYEDRAIAGIHVNTTAAEDGHAAAFNGFCVDCDEGRDVLSINARVNAYFPDIDYDDPYSFRPRPRAFEADGIETHKPGGAFYQSDLDQKSYVPHGIAYHTNDLLGSYGSGLNGWFGEVPSGLLPFPEYHAFSTVARNYGTWDFTGADDYLTPGFYDGKHIYYGAQARTRGGVYAPGASRESEKSQSDAGGNAWENFNLSNANSGLWNYGTMIGNGRATCYSRDGECTKNGGAPAGAPVLSSATQHYFYNSDGLNGEGIPNFLYIYNAGYYELDFYYDSKVKSESLIEEPYYFEDQSYATYGVIGSANTPSAWRFDPQYAFNTNFGFQTAGGVDWDFVEGTLLEDGQLWRFAAAAEDRLLEANDGKESGGAGILMLNEGLLIGTVKEEIDSDADVLGLGRFLDDELGIGGGNLSSLHFNLGTWFTRGWNGFLGVEDVYANAGLVQSAFEQYRREWTVFDDLELTVNAGGIYSLLDGGTEDRLTFGGDYFGGLGYVPILGPVSESEPEHDLSYLEQGYFALDAFLAMEDNPRASGDLFHINGYLGGYTGLIVRDANPDVSQGVNHWGIPVVTYEDVGVLGGGGCAYTYAGVCGEFDTVFIDPQTPNYNKEGDIPVIVDGLYDWTLWHFEDGYGPPLPEVKGDVNGQFRLISDYGGNSARLPGVTYGAQQIWYEILRIAERQRNQQQSGGGGADLNTYAVADYVEPAAPGSSSGLWAKFGGSWIETDTSLTQGVMSYDTSFDQDIYSILGGADMKPGGADSPYQIGIFGGYVTSDVDFNAGAPGTSVDYEGGSFGAYANYINGGFFVDGLVKAEYLDTTYDLGGGFGNVDADLWNLGVLANTGYRMEMGWAFLEPLASIAYVHTSVDDGSNNGTSVDFSNGTSFRAGAGARVGTVMAMGSATTEFSLLGQIWNEFEGDNKVTVSDGVTSQTFTDDTSGVFGEAEAAITVTNSDGTLSGFLSGGGKWGEHFDAWNAQVGIRKNF